MAVRNALWVQAAGPTGLLTVEDTRVGTSAFLYSGASNLVAKSGFKPGAVNDPGGVTASGTPDANVHVAPFQLVLQTTRATVGGAYVMTLDASATVNILSTPADPTNPRNDLVIAQQSDTFYGDGVSTWQIRQVVGTPSGSPVDPTVSGSTDYVTLARVRVNANATTITTGNITDLRTSGHAKSLVGGLYTSALGSILPVNSQTERDALSSYDGLSVYRRDNDWLEINNGVGWQQVTPYRARQTLSGSAATVTFSSIPSTLRSLRLRWTARSDNAVNAQFISIQVNGNSGANYSYEFVQGNNTTASANNGVAQTGGVVGLMVGASASAGVFSSGAIDVIGWDNQHASSLGWNFMSQALGTGVANFFTMNGGGNASVAGPYTSVTILPQAGNFITGSDFQLEGM